MAGWPAKSSFRPTAARRCCNLACCQSQQDHLVNTCQQPFARAVHDVPLLVHVLMMAGCWVQVAAGKLVERDAEVAHLQRQLHAARAAAAQEQGSQAHALASAQQRAEDLAAENAALRAQLDESVQAAEAVAAKAALGAAGECKEVDEQMQGSAAEVALLRQECSALDARCQQVEGHNAELAAKCGQLRELVEGLELRRPQPRVAEGASGCVGRGGGTGAAHHPSAGSGAACVGSS